MQKIKQGKILINKDEQLSLFNLSKLSVEQQIKTRNV